MKNLHFLWVFLISLLPLTLAQSEALRSLPHYVLALATFNKIDTNRDNIIDRIESLAYYESLKQDPSDKEIKRDYFIKLVTKGYGFTSTVANSVYDEFDEDDNGVVNEEDNKLMYRAFDTDGNELVTIDEFIIADNDMLIAAGVPVLFGK
ncbi:unnamed protein product [Lymnaea stagnalis]|uniref:EF-hand domain-containing protein n=1 Tax=Lymnaea stagnalis TaxID=6523 RepID=A0AAV2IBC2_LYMST